MLPLGDMAIHPIEEFLDMRGNGHLIVPIIAPQCERLVHQRGQRLLAVVGIPLAQLEALLDGIPVATDSQMPPAHPAGKGEFQRIALDLLRETGEPISSQMVAQRFCENRELTLDDHAFRSIRYRASSGLYNMRLRKMVRRIGPKGPEARWQLVEGFDIGRARYWRADFRELSEQTGL